MTTTRSPLSAPSPEIVNRLAAIVGAEHALTDPATQEPYLVEWRDKYRGRTPLVLRPGTTEEVSRILAVADAARVGVVPQGGNTGLVGGQIPFEAGTEIVVSLSRLDRVRRLDAAGGSVTVEAGVTLAVVRALAAEADRLFPMNLPSEGSCQVGGNLATNAGGANVLAFGTMRDLVLGLEVVLADGRVWDGLRSLRKDNTGYDLRDLFIGSEGTLGVITAAVLKLWPRPRETVTAMLALGSMEAALDILQRLQARFGAALTAFEFIPAIAMAFLERHVPDAKSPFAARHPWQVLLELSSPVADGATAAALAEALAAPLAGGLVIDARVAASDRQGREMWRLREAISEVQKFEGGSIKHDVSVPVALLPEFVARADAIVARVIPGARPVPFGHFGDGNVHYNVSQPVAAEKAAFLAQWEPLSREIHDLVSALGGSISAEHGIGRMKRDELVRAKSAVELDLMRSVKAALDPNGILNPGKLL